VRIVAIETTESIGTVAALIDGNLLLELELDAGKRSAQSLAPGLKALLEKVAWRPDGVNLVAVTAGPGSFTGLRVGVATAKAFAYCAKADILGMDTLEVIAARAPDHVADINVAVDAQRGQVVAARFCRDPGGWFRLVAPAKLLDIEAWLGGLPHASMISGPVLRKIAGRVPDHVRILDHQCWSPSAAAVGRVAARDYAQGRRDSVWALVPRYSRRSAAEEKWEARHAGRQNRAD
jgi:tRNA threonylcarbamoyladenosine biosynthesis protein TsaB